MSDILLGIISFLCGLGGGWVIWRNERTYQQGWRDGHYHGRFEGFKIALQKISRGHLINPETLDFYDK